jgi:hypothetical protein
MTSRKTAHEKGDFYAASKSEQISADVLSDVRRVYSNYGGDASRQVADIRPLPTRQRGIATAAPPDQRRVPPA